jgi:hypothetical protein
MENSDSESKNVVSLEIDRDHIMECVMDYYIRHKSTWTEIVGVLKLLNRVAKQEIIPSTKYSFFKHFQKDFDFSFHVFCTTESCSSIEMIKCGSEKIEYVCPQCHTKNPVKDVKVAVCNI